MSEAVDSERSWKRPVLPLLIPFLNPFSGAKRPVVLGKFVTVASIVPFGIHAPVVLNIASKTMPCLVCCREAEVRRCCFYLNLGHRGAEGGWRRRRVPGGARWAGKVVATWLPDSGRVNLDGFCEPEPRGGGRREDRAHQVQPKMSRPFRSIQLAANTRSRAVQPTWSMGMAHQAGCTKPGRLTPNSLGRAYQARCRWEIARAGILDSDESILLSISQLSVNADL